ncbi:Aminoglycoside 2'-N-acetyltransferase [Nocardioides sp. T2.26MG-1]|uniref:GNAT family N-acetyltransferase n=1 Tax=Nocardioides sp. T2.26MG-1 TaxID=3041166 RepID=UPI00247778F4|nr:GNAT family N-acetyltransferase [Nocardioides sp. T2.26MG-1]CAI9418842.1 Aminoglycoside 2'-N-acetyltransferase [Nocardioides sp. T2.26MG-1]
MLRRCHTAELTASELAGARALLDLAFRDFTDHDWAHALGGMHALVVEEGRLLAHGSLVARRVHHGGWSLRCGYVEAVAVHPDARRRGLASQVMASLEELAPAYDLLALSASELGIPLYLSRGWQRWRGSSYVLAADGPTPTPEDDDSIYVLPGSARLDLDAPIACDWRDGDVW